MTVAEVRSQVSMSRAVEAVRAAFLAYGRGEFSAPHFWEEDAQYVLKAVVHRPTGTMTVKTLTVNTERRPLVSGVIAHLDRASGTELVADAATVTSLRTGAIVGVATDLLADRDASRLALLGAGAQAADQFRAVAAVRDLRSLTVTDADPARAEQLLDHLRPELHGIVPRWVREIPAAVADADIVCCATSSAAPLFALDALPGHVHVNAIGSYRPDMRELPDELLEDATVVVDDRTAVQHEAGEIVHAITTGAVGPNDLVELAHALAAPPVRRSRTVFKTVGIAVQDWAIMNALAAAT